MKRETIEQFTRDTAVQTMNNIVDETMKINETNNEKKKKEKINKPKNANANNSNAREQL